MKTHARTLLVLAAVWHAPLAASDASTEQLASYALESLAYEEDLVLPAELRRRGGDLARLATSIKAEDRALATILLALIGRDELIPSSAYQVREDGPTVERISAAFITCRAARRCSGAVAQLRELGKEPAKKRKPPQLGNLQAVLLLSLLPQPGFDAYVDGLKTEDAGQQEALRLAKARHARLFPAGG